MREAGGVSETREGGRLGREAKGGEADGARKAG